MKIIFFIALLFLLKKAAHAQISDPRVETLRKEIYSNSNPNHLKKKYLDLLHYEYNYPYDSLGLYTQKLLELAKASNDTNSLKWGHLYRFNYFSGKKMIDSAEKYKSLITKPHLWNNTDSFALRVRLALINDHRINTRSNDVITATYELSMHFPKTNYVKGFLNYYFGIGLGIKGKYNEALKEYAKINITATGTDTAVYIRSLISRMIAQIHVAEERHNTNVLDTIQWLPETAKNLAKISGNNFSYAQSNVLSGYLHTYKGNFKEAEKEIKEGLSIDRYLGNITYEVSDLTVLSTFYAMSNQPELGIKSADLGLELIKKHSLASQLYILVTFAKSQNYEVAKDYKNYGATMKQLMKYKDSLYYKSTDAELEKLEVIYNLQNTKLEMAEQKNHLQRNTFLAIIATSALLLTLIASLILIWQYKKKKKLELQILIDNENRKKADELNVAMDTERKRIAADLHDNLGVKANAIMYNASKLLDPTLDKHEISENLQGMAKEMMINLRDTLWVMNHSTISGNDLWMRLKNFVQLMNRQYTNMQIQILGDAPLKLFSSEAAMDTLMILQEAVNNAIKHSRGNLVLVTGKVTPTNWDISVTDNGEGFDTGLVKSHNYSYGLTGMAERASKNGYYLTTTSHPGHPTTVLLTIFLDK